MAPGPRRAIPCMIASSGCKGVESSLKISILPSRTTTKSVNVPPVSIPILKIDPRDILNVLGRNGFEALYGPLRIALPSQRLNIGVRIRKLMNRDFANPGEIHVRE